MTHTIKFTAGSWVVRTSLGQLVINSRTVVSFTEALSAWVSLGGGR